MRSVLGGLAVLGLLVAGTAPLLRSGDTPPSRAASPAAVPPYAGGQAAAPLPTAPPASFSAGDHVLLGTEHAVVRVDLATGATRVLRLPSAVWTPTSHRLVVARSDVVVAASPIGDQRGRGPTVYAFDGTAAGRRLGWGQRVVASRDGTGVWLDRDGGRGNRVRLVDLAGATPAASAPLDRAERVVADTSAGLLVSAGSGSAPGPLVVRDRESGKLVRRVAAVGTVLDAAGPRVVWTACGGCPPVVTRVDTGAYAPLETGGLDNVLAARLAPDGRHVALVVTGATAGSWDVAVAHLPDDSRSGNVRPVLPGLRPGPSFEGPPQLGWTASNRLVVSDGRGLFGVSTGSVASSRVSIPVPAHLQLAVG